MRIPLNCTLDYYQHFLTPVEAEALFQEFESDYSIGNCPIVSEVNGKEFRTEFGKITVMDQALYDKNAFPSSIYGMTMPWPSSLKDIKGRIEVLTARKFQFCVCIYYPDGNSGVDFHSDPPAFGDTAVIPSLSLGEERNFLLKEKASEAIHEMVLASGSLLIMGEHCQERYEHCLPVDPIYKKPRINMTFRQYYA